MIVESMKMTQMPRTVFCLGLLCATDHAIIIVCNAKDVGKSRQAKWVFIYNWQSFCACVCPQKALWCSCECNSRLRIRTRAWARISIFLCKDYGSVPAGLGRGPFSLPGIPVPPPKMVDLTSTLTDGGKSQPLAEQKRSRWRQSWHTACKHLYTNLGAIDGLLLW